MPNIVEYTVLRCGRCVPTSLYNSVHNRVLKSAPGLEHGVPYTLKMICGEPYWSGLSNFKTQADWSWPALSTGNSCPICLPVIEMKNPCGTG